MGGGQQPRERDMRSNQQRVEAWWNGFRARVNRVLAGANPEPPTDAAHRAWRAGWEAGIREQRIDEQANSAPDSAPKHEPDSLGNPVRVEG